MGFDAGQVAEPLDYDFTTVEGGKGKGVVPEPSETEMKSFMKASMRVRRDMEKIVKSYDDLAEKNKDKTLTEEQEAEAEDKIEKESDKLNKLIAKLCKQHPSVEEVATLPYRHKILFSQWLMDELSPNGGTSGTTT